MVEEKIEAPKRIWIPQSALMNGGGSIYIGQAWDDNDTEYVRVDRAPNTRQRAVVAAGKIKHYVYEYFSAVIASKMSDERLADIIAAEFEK